MTNPDVVVLAIVVIFSIVALTLVALAAIGAGQKDVAKRVIAALWDAVKLALDALKNTPQK